jgi:hypothetical protein
MELEDTCVKEAKKILKWVKREVQFGSTVGRDYVNTEEIKWNLGKVEGIKFVLNKLLSSKGINKSDFERKHRIHSSSRTL